MEAFFTAGRISDWILLLTWRCQKKHFTGRSHVFFMFFRGCESASRFGVVFFRPMRPQGGTAVRREKSLLWNKGGGAVPLFRYQARFGETHRTNTQKCLILAEVPRARQCACKKVGRHFQQGGLCRSATGGALSLISSRWEGRYFKNLD